MKLVPLRTRLLPPSEAAQKVLSAIQRMDAALAELNQLTGPDDPGYLNEVDRREIHRFDLYVDAAHDPRTLQASMPRLIELALQRVG